MKTLDLRRWIWQYVLPIVILVLAYALTYLIFVEWLGHEAPNVVFLLGIAPVVAFLIGFVVRPHSTVVIPIVALVAWEVAAVISMGLSHALGILLPTIALLGLPLWFLIWTGKRIRPWFDEYLESRRRMPMG
jgi:hypothetical protein